jgi:hypothetical protein
MRQLIAADTPTGVHDLLDHRHILNAELSTTKSVLRYQFVHGILPSLAFHSKEMAFCPAKNARLIELLRGYPVRKEIAACHVFLQLPYITHICHYRKRASPYLNDMP